MSLKDISAATKTPISTSSDMIRISKMGWTKNLNPAKNFNPDASNDPSADENLKTTPKCKKEANEVLSNKQKQYAIGLALRDATHC